MSIAQPIASPSGLASIFNPTSSPSSLSTPDGNAQRLVQKQVVRVKGRQTEVVVMLYMKLAVPKRSRTQILQLFPDEGISLKASQVYPVSMAKGGRTLIPPNANPTLLKASDVLAINRATPTSSLPYEEVTVSGQDQTSRSSKKAKITTSNFHVCFVIPPVMDSTSSEKDDSRLHFVAIVQMTIPFVLSPPKWPYLVRIPLPRCLNNYLNFSVEEDTVQDNTIVEVEPTLISKPQQLASGKFKRDSGMGQEVEGIDVDSDQNLSGMFYSTPFLTIRWTGDDAGEYKQSSEVTSKGHHPVRAELLQSSIVYTEVRAVDTSLAEVDMTVDLSLDGAYFPGLDSTANLNLHLEGPSNACWKQDSISMTPSRSSASALHSWDLGQPTGSSKHSIKSTSGSTRLTVDEIFAPLAQQSPDGSSDGILELDSTMDEEGNLDLLNVRPPRGISSPELDSSFEEDDEGFDLATIKQSKKGRRHSLSVRPRDTIRPSTPDLPVIDPSQTTGRVIYMVLNVAPLFRGEGKFSCSLKGTIRLSIERTQGDDITISLPLVKARGIALQVAGEVCEINGKIVDHGSSVILLDGKDSTNYQIILPPNPSRAELNEGIAKVQARTSVGQAEGLGDISAATTSMQQEFERTISDESMRDFSREVLQGNGVQGQDVRAVDSLSGMIQEASAEIHIATVMRNDPFLDARIPGSVKTTHALSATWPSSLAPSSPSSVCGNLLQRMVFAIPVDEKDELQLLYASINGLCVNVSDEDGSGSRGGDSDKSRSSRIVDLQLPESLRQAAKIEVYLLYTIESPTLQQICIFPPVASSIAQLKLKIDHDSFPSMTPTLTFANQPLSCLDQRDAIASGIKQSTAYMIPSMTTITLTLNEEAKYPVPILASPEGPIRKATLVQNSRWNQQALNTASTFYILCALMLTIALIGTLVSLEPMVGSLSRKVDSLALALNVDFSDGTWKPDANVPADDLDAILHRPPLQYDCNDVDQLRKTESINDDKMNKEHHHHHHPRPQQQTSLSIDTTSFTLLLQSISLDFTRAISWPIRILLSLFHR